MVYPGYREAWKSALHCKFFHIVSPISISLLPLFNWELWVLTSLHCDNSLSDFPLPLLTVHQAHHLHIYIVAHSRLHLLTISHISRNCSHSLLCITTLSLPFFVLCFIVYILFCIWEFLKDLIFTFWDTVPNKLYKLRASLLKWLTC